MVEIQGGAVAVLINATRQFASLFRSYFRWSTPRIDVRIETKRNERPSSENRQFFIFFTNNGEMPIHIYRYRIKCRDLIADFDPYTPANPMSEIGEQPIPPGGVRQVRLQAFANWADNWFLVDPLRVEVFAAGYKHPVTVFWRYGGDVHP